MNRLHLVWTEEDGVLSFEWTLLLTLLTIGIVGGLAARPRRDHRRARRRGRGGSGIRPELQSCPTLTCRGDFHDEPQCVCRNACGPVLPGLRPRAQTRARPRYPTRRRSGSVVCTDIQRSAGEPEYRGNSSTDCGVKTTASSRSSGRCSCVLVVIGIVSGIGCRSRCVIDELGDMAEAVLQFDQSYSFVGRAGAGHSQQLLRRSVGHRHRLRPQHGLSTRCRQRRHRRRVGQATRPDHGRNRRN